ncbi:MAG: nucleoside hydrolase [Desulfobacterales bacterium]
MAQKVILDIDNALTIPAQDTDDALALALALVSPELEVLGCTTCAGNCRTAQSTLNTLRLLEAGGIHGVPVAEGHPTALSRDREAHFGYLAAKTDSPQCRYWEGLPEPPAVDRPPEDLAAAEFIVQSVRNHPGEIVFVALGALTNLALALLDHPDLAASIKGLVHMGGSFAPADGPPFVWQTPDIPEDVWRTTLRFNTVFDPEAAAVVFRSGIPLTLVPANVTSLVFQRPGHLEALERGGTPWHRFLATYARPWVEWSIHERHLPGAHMHDPLTVALVIDPSFCHIESMDLSVPALLTGKGPWLSLDSGGMPVKAASQVDAPRFESWLAERLGGPVLDRYHHPPAPAE